MTNMIGLCALGFGRNALPLGPCCPTGGTSHATQRETAASTPVALLPADRQEREQWATCARQASRGQAFSFQVPIGGAKGHVCSVECTPAARVELPPSSSFPHGSVFPYFEVASASVTGFQDLTPLVSLTSHYFASSRTGHAVSLAARRSTDAHPVAAEVGLSKCWSPPEEGEAYAELAHRKKRGEQQRWRASQRVAVQWEGTGGLPALMELRPKWKTTLELPWAQCTAEWKPRILGQSRSFAKLGVRQRAVADGKGQRKSWNADLTRVAEQRTTLQCKANQELGGWRFREQLKLCSQSRATLELRCRQNGKGARPWQVLMKTSLGEHGKVGVGRVFKCEDAAHGVVWEAEMETSKKAAFGFTFQAGTIGNFQNENGLYARCGTKCFF